MGNKGRRGAALSDKQIRSMALVTGVCDIFLIAALVACLFAYITYNNGENEAHNVENITSIAATEANLMQVALDNAGAEVISACRYCSGKRLAEMLDYLSTIDPEGEYQLLRRNPDDSTARYHVYDGFSTRKTEGAYQAVRYEDTSLASSLYTNAPKAEGEVSFSQNFTNQTDALRYFAAFSSVTAVDGGTETQYFLIRPQKADRVLDQLQTYSPYAELAIAVCYTDGRYLAHDDAFRGSNFYDYLYRYNDLSIDERDAVRDAVLRDEDGTGALTYLDFMGRETLFAYASCGGDQDWQVLVSVLRSAFVSEKMFSLFPTIIILFLAVLLIFNIWRLMVIVRALRRSVERERVANTAKSDFLSRMSHEIRTPLNAVIGYNTIARDELAAGDGRQGVAAAMDCLNKEELASRHLLCIINDVLDMSAIESGKIRLANERFDFRGLITALTAIFYSQAKEKGVDFQVVFESMTEEWFSGDQVRINQILTNLLSNAIKFTPEGGMVTLRITQPDADETSVRLRFAVSDTGIGMQPDYLAHIWKPFEQEDASINRRFGGTGLGLSITKNLVDIMGGSIAVDSTPGKGSTFRVELTLERTTQPATGGTYDFSAVNALAVDDDESTREYIRLLFDRCGARCATAASGREALRMAIAAREQGSPFTLYLVDWKMPQMDGLETIRRIRETEGGAASTVVLTAYDYGEIIKQAGEAGVDRFASKPLFQSTLFDLLAGFGTISVSTDKRGDHAKLAGSRVLLAEDNAMNMEIAARLLQSVGLLVDGAWDGKEAVERFEAAPPGAYQAILMDVHMPVMNGHTAARAIRGSAHPDAKTVPIIAMTADAFAENVAQAREAGMNDHIAKPIDVSVLFSTLEKYIRPQGPAASAAPDA